MSDPEAPTSQAPPPRRPSPDVIREFHDRGVQWLLEDRLHAGDLLQIWDPDLVALLDFSRAIRVNRTLVPPDLRKRERDIIYRVPFRGSDTRSGREVWVYLLLEHQSEPDPTMGLRIYLYRGQLWELQAREWEDRNLPAGQRRLELVVPVVLYTGEDRWSTPIGLENLMEVAEPMGRFVPTWETVFFDLRRTAAETLTRFATAVGWALRVLQAEAAPLAEMERVLTEAMAGLEGLSEEQVGQWLSAAWFLVSIAFHRRPEPEKMLLVEKVKELAAGSKFHLREELDQMEKTYVQVLEERGEARGAERMLREGLEIVLTERFGALTPELRAALAAADTETMRAWLRAAATATTLEGVGIRN
jgi:hypothetical protein